MLHEAFQEFYDSLNRKQQLKFKAIKAVAKPIIEQALSNAEEKVKDLAVNRTSILFMQDTDLAVQTILASGEGGGYYQFVKSLLASAAGIGSQTLGSQPESWAHGKSWYVTWSMPSPQAGNGFGLSYDYLENSANFSNYVRSDILSNNSSPIPPYTPARFSFLLGSGTDAQSLEPTCATQSCFGYKSRYEQVNATARTEALGEAHSSFFQKAFEENAGKVPVLGVTASSSAFAAGMVQSQLTAPFTSSCFNVAVWNAAGAPAWEAWVNGIMIAHQRPGLTSQAASETAATMFQPALDGAYTDNTGIAWLVAAGQTSITFFCVSFDSLEGLFGRPDDAPPPFNLQSFKIFAGSWEDAQAQYDMFSQLALPADLQFLQRISYGVIETETVENPWFGIPKGRKVTLNIINVVNTPGIGEITMGGLNNFYNYAVFVQEIVDVMTSVTNAGHTKSILKQFFGIKPAGITSSCPVGLKACCSQGKCSCIPEDMVCCIKKGSDTFQCPANFQCCGNSCAGGGVTKCCEHGNGSKYPASVLTNC